MRLISLCLRGIAVLGAIEINHMQPLGAGLCEIARTPSSGSSA